MKQILNYLSLIIFCLGCVYIFAQNAAAKGDITVNNNSGDKKMLIAYFSWGGNTKSIAQKIQAQTGADMFQIETKIPYPKDYNETAYGVAKEQHDKGIKPELKDNGNVSDYDIIFVGTPAWWYTMAPAVMTFLENNDFKGKKIVPFITHGGGGGYNIAKEMGDFAVGSTVLKPMIIYERGNSDTEGDIKNWLKELDL